MSIVKRRHQPFVDTSFNMTELFNSIVETEERKNCIVAPENCDPHEYNAMMTREEYMRMYFEHQNYYRDDSPYDGSEDDTEQESDTESVKEEKFELSENQTKIDDFFEKQDNNPNIDDDEEQEDEYWKENQDYEDWKIYVKPSSDLTDKYDENEEKWEQEYERQRFFDYDETYNENKSGSSAMEESD
jgi:hypothetical protein